MARVPENRVKKQKSLLPFWGILLLIVVVLNALSDDPTSILKWDAFGQLFFAAIVVAILELVTWIRSRARGRKQQNDGDGAKASAAQRQTPSVQMHRPAPAMSRSAHRDFSAPEAPCIVCEQTGEDHFQRDKARRLAQLDDWLKIGLIDRSEYRVLKDRYQRGI